MRPTKFTPLALTALLLASACATTPHQPPVPTPTPTATPTPTPTPIGLTRAQAEPLVISAFADLLKRFPDPIGMDLYCRRLMLPPSDRDYLTDATMREDIKASAEYKALHAPKPTPRPDFTIVNGKIPAPVLATIRLYASAFPLPRGDGSEAWLDAALRGGWTKRLGEQLRFTYGPAWGQKRRSMGAPVSAGAIAMQQGDGMHVWDILIGTATGAPTLSDGEYFWVTDQMFWPVEPVDHLTEVRGPPTDRPAIATPFRGITSFDVAARLQAGDRRWIDQVLVPTKLTARVVVYANGLNAPRISRDAAAGLVQIELLLKEFVALGLKGQFVLLCNTAVDQWTREQGLDMIRKENALFVRYASAVAGLQIGNENSHGIEMPWMTDVTFLQAAEDLIDKRFPVAWGAGHGGEGVSIAGGSYLVHHADRGLTPDENGAIMAAAQAIAKRPVIDDEPLGIAEPDRVAGRQRTADPQYARRQAEAAKKHGLGGSTLHIDAGLTANVDELGPVQRAAIEAFMAATKPITMSPPKRDDHDEDEWPLAA